MTAHAQPRMAVIIAGGRDFDPGRRVAWWERLVISPLMIWEATHVITGGARGADAWAHDVVSRHMPSAQRNVFHADWALGRKAGPIRNRTMASYADACILLPGGRGTQNMKEEADRMKLLVLDLRRLGDVP